MLRLARCLNTIGKHLKGLHKICTFLGKEPFPCFFADLLMPNLKKVHPYLYNVTAAFSVSFTVPYLFDSRLNLASSFLACSAINKLACKRESQIACKLLAQGI